MPPKTIGKVESSSPPAMAGPAVDSAEALEEIPGLFAFQEFAGEMPDPTTLKARSSGPFLQILKLHRLSCLWAISSTSSNLKDGSFYIGSITDPALRLRKHSAPHKGYTARMQPWRLVYVEEFPDKATALRREGFLKEQKSHDFLLRLISGSSAG